MPSWVLIICKDGHSTAFKVSMFDCCEQRRFFLTFKWNFLYFNLCPLLLVRIPLGRFWLSLFASSHGVFVHAKIALCSLSCLNLTNTTSLSLSSCVRCSTSLIFAALFWIHSRNQTACSTFGIVGVSGF